MQQEGEAITARFGSNVSKGICTLSKLTNTGRECCTYNIVITPPGKYDNL